MRGGRVESEGRGSEGRRSVVVTPRRAPAPSPHGFADRLQRTLMAAPPADHRPADVPAPLRPPAAVSHDLGFPFGIPVLMTLAVGPARVPAAIRRPPPSAEVQRRLLAAAHTVLAADVIARRQLVAEIDIRRVAAVELALELSQESPGAGCASVMGGRTARGRRIPRRRNRGEETLPSGGPM